ncbi:MAG: hypothetical protein D3916_03315 [Candidatus Electrothrix sp. MAN1_4]|nr:hypothetical protein [Candidatus Electrothrix sp. MAN1_4]
MKQNANTAPEDDPTKVNYKNEGGYVYECTARTNGNPKECTEWTQQYYWSNSTVDDYCPAGSTSGEIADDNWEDPADIDIDHVGSDGFNKIEKAINDFCDQTSVPEIIDPSESAGYSTLTGNFPNIIRDADLVAQLGITYPLAVMKGYIKETDRPQGIIHSVADDLRFGVMSFHKVGAATECLPENISGSIERYCPQNNMDGAQLLRPLKDGALVTDFNDTSYFNNTRRHVDEVAEAINTIQGTSWTPLGEAMFGALGYYTQNNDLCLNLDNNTKCLDWCLETNTAGNCTDLADEDPVQYWCQDNHILLITEGESTADINEKISGFPSAGINFSSRSDFSGTCECHPDNKEGETCLDDSDENGDGDDTDTECANTIFSSTYLDDMTWWAQNVRPLYKDRCIPDLINENVGTEKGNIFTHIVATSLLGNEDNTECSPETLMTAAAMNGSGGERDYYKGENPEALEKNLKAVLDDILSRASAGSAASVISSSRSGSGAVYQAVFWPEYEYEDAAGETQQVAWVGNVHSLFMNAEGKMYEDTDHDGKLDENEDDRVMFYFSSHVNKTRGCYAIDEFIETGNCPDDSEAECGAGHKCVEINNINYLWSANNYLEGLSDDPVAADSVHKKRKIYTWNDADNDGMVDSAEWFRLEQYMADKWEELNKIAAKTADENVDGKDVDGNDRGPVSRDFLTSDDWANFVGNDGPDDDDATIETISDYEYDALNALIGWLHGEDQRNDEASSGTDNNNDRIDKELRSRRYRKGTKDYTWRLGDVIHSTPIVVSRPAEAYNYIYRDPTYNDFADKWAKRRSVVYFGANDGMLHAVNAGFYFEDGNQFCCTEELETDGTCKVSPSEHTYTATGVTVTGYCGDDEPDLGEELWAYIPYNLQPHLKCLADELYAHKYFVDQKPRIFDVQIFAEEEVCATNGLDDSGCIHPGGWGTILVGSMRFGGSPVLAESLNDDQNDKREFISSFFILDITNPEVDLTAAGAEPLLLGEMTRTTETETRTEFVEKTDGDGNTVTDENGDPVLEEKVITDENGDAVLFDVFSKLNYTTSVPAMVVMRDGGENAVTSKWYLVMGNGPTEQSGKNTYQAQIAIFPLERLKGEMMWSTTEGSGPGTAGRPYKYKNSGVGAFRVFNKEPFSDNLLEQPGRFLVPKAMNLTDTSRNQPGFISDIISVDYNIDMTAPDNLGARYRTDAIYFGTTDGSDFAPYLDEHAPDDQFYWNGGGRLFRMVTKVLDTDNEESASLPSEWAARWPTTEPSATQDSAGPIRMLLDVKRPITAGPSIGYDGENYWIYAGTGRFWDEMDKTDDGWCIDGASSDTCWNANESNDPMSEKRVQSAMFGVKEPTADARSGSDWGWASSVTPVLTAADIASICTEKIFTWQTINWDITSQDNTKLAPAKAPSQRGLMKTDDILVGTDEDSTLGCFHCVTDVTTGDYRCSVSSSCFLNSTDNLIDDLIHNGSDYTFDLLKQYIAGTGCEDVDEDYSSGMITATFYNRLVNSEGVADGAVISTGIDGWYNEFHDPRERNLGATALLGGLLTFTSYQPFNDKCQAEGQSFLYGLHYQTGTAPQESVFGTFSETDGSIQPDGSGARINPKLGLGRGLSTTPSMHVGSSDDHAAKAFIQTSTGEIIEVTQEKLPYDNTKSGRMGWTDRCE